jgi:predicted O-methyltransferase YrrM
MVRPIRPHVIFDKVQGNRLVTLPIPIRSLGSPLLIETFVLLAVGKIVKPKRIFEIGTYRGNTTLNLSLNFPEAEVYTLDVNQQHSPEQLAGRLNVTLLQCHSMDFDFSHYHGDVDLVFVDGAHDYETVVSDTAAAFRMLRQGGAIVWHDYLNPDPHFDGVTRVLKEILQKVQWVEDTMMGVYFG